MNRRKALVAIAAAPLALKASTTLAGGMTVVYLVGDLPRVVAREPFRLRFASIAHDMVDHLWNSFDAEIRLIPRDGSDHLIFTVPGRQSSIDSLGIYETEITVPQSGQYKWSIKIGSWEPTYFPTLHVDIQGSEGNLKGDEALVAIGSTAFSPPETEITVGSTVVWHNQDSLSSHQVTWTDLTLDDSAPIPVGGEFRYTFDQPGEYQYFCGPHPAMVGKVTVV